MLMFFYNAQKKNKPLYGQFGTSAHVLGYKRQNNWKKYPKRNIFSLHNLPFYITYKKIKQDTLLLWVPTY